jgi:ferredoxin
MRIVVDLVRCQTYGQCVFAAPTVFELHGEQKQILEYAP